MNKDKISDTGIPVSDNMSQNWFTQIYADGIPIVKGVITGFDVGQGEDTSSVSVFGHTGYSCTFTQKLSRKKHQQLLKYFGVGYKKCRVPRKLKKQNKKRGITP